MNAIIEQIQADILNPKVSLNTILLKAKVLAHQLKNQRLKEWVRSELDGYPDARELPDYRVLPAPLLAFIFNGYNGRKNVPISLSECPDWFQEGAAAIRFADGVRTAEEFALLSQGIVFPWPAEWIDLWNAFNPLSGGGGHEAVEISRSVSPQHFAQISETVRSRLQDFVLELSDLPWSMVDSPPPPDQIERLVAVTIYNTPGGTVSAFDQRGQQIQNQNNAARDVNISGGITIGSNTDLVEAVRALRGLLDQVEGDAGEETSAIEVLERAAQDDSTSKRDIVGAVETLGRVPAMRQHLENLAIGATSSLGATGLIEAIKFVLS